MKGLEFFFFFFHYTKISADETLKNAPGMTQHSIVFNQFSVPCAGSVVIYLQMSTADCENELKSSKVSFLLVAGMSEHYM